MKSIFVIFLWIISFNYIMDASEQLLCKAVQSNITQLKDQLEKGDLQAGYTLLFLSKLSHDAKNAEECSVLVKKKLGELGFSDSCGANAFSQTKFSLYDKIEKLFRDGKVVVKHEYAKVEVRMALHNQFFNIKKKVLAYDMVSALAFDGLYKFLSNNEKIQEQNALTLLKQYDLADEHAIFSEVKEVLLEEDIKRIFCAQEEETY